MKQTPNFKKIYKMGARDAEAVILEKIQDQQERGYEANTILQSIIADLTINQIVPPILPPESSESYPQVELDN